MQKPIFVKGQIKATIQGHEIDKDNVDISVFGVTSLPWGSINPKEVFGTEVPVKVETRQGHVFRFECPASITKETTAFSSHMGLRFKLPEEVKTHLACIIEENGYYPTTYLRKFPRIPASITLQNYPLRVLGVLKETETHPVRSPFPFAFDVRNLSPNGILVYTENPRATEIEPEHRIKLTLEPRGEFPAAVEVDGMVCRIMDDKHDETGNLIRSFGIKFIGVNPKNRAIFTELLEKIIHQLQSQDRSSTQ